VRLSLKGYKPLIYLIGYISLTGCTTTRYVTVPCVNQQQYEQLRDSEPTKVKDKLTGKADEDIKTLGGSAVRLRGWGQGLLGVLEGCQG
jgi:hypothetical protein